MWLHFCSYSCPRPRRHWDTWSRGICEDVARKIYSRSWLGRASEASICCLDQDLAGSSAIPMYTWTKYSYSTSTQALESYHLSSPLELYHSPSEADHNGDYEWGLHLFDFFPNNTQYWEQASQIYRRVMIFLSLKHFSRFMLQLEPKLSSLLIGLFTTNIFSSLTKI